MSRIGWASVVAAGALLLAACGDDSDSSEDTVDEPNEEAAGDDLSPFCVEVAAVEEGMEDAFLSDDSRTFADLLLAGFTSLGELEAPSEIAADWELWTDTQRQYYQGVVDIAPDDEPVNPHDEFDDPAVADEMAALEEDLGLDDLDGEVYQAEGRVLDYLDAHCLLEEGMVESEPEGDVAEQ